MNSVARGLAAVLLGFIIGSAVNMSLVILGPMVIPPPPGVDLTTPEGLEKGMPLLEARHFLFPFLAHALGTLVGAFVAAKIAVSRKMAFALGIGLFFLLGGVVNIVLLGSPLWFNVIDLVLAYIPMAFIGGTFATKGVNRGV